jgi:hypothetical protein
MTPETLPASSSAMVSKRPTVWEQLQRGQTSSSSPEGTPSRFRRQAGQLMNTHGPNCQCPRHEALAEKLNPRPFGE